MTITELLPWFALIGALYGATAALRREWRKINEQFDAKYTGYWVNEGDVTTGITDTHSVSIELTSKDREISGLLESHGIKVEQEIEADITGKRELFRPWRARGELVKVVSAGAGGGDHARVDRIARVKLNLKGKLMHCRFDDVWDDVAPRTAVLWRHDRDEVSKALEKAMTANAIRKILGKSGQS
ncbi:MAG: hypothetical protein EPO08_03280 [Rhodospirillaceae bacterium]|nr:MAG: hypothetical protein EPO08_03280 [Rhodospirillaceae bacterium]